MANDAASGPTSCLTDQYATPGALGQSPVSQNPTDAGFLAQVSGNQFFTAVRQPQLRDSSESLSQVAGAWPS